MTDLISSALSRSSWQKWILMLVLLGAAALWMSPVSASAADDWKDKGDSFLDAGHYNEAIAAYNKAIELDPNYVAAWGNKGNALYTLVRYDEALAAYNKTIELDPNNTKAWFAKGVALYTLGRYDEALAAYNKVIGLDPNFSSAWGNKGVALGDLGRYDEAFAAYNKSIELDPKNSTVAWSGKGNALNNLGKYQESLDACNKALSIDPNYTNAWNDKGNALGNLGKYQESLVAYNKALSIDPNFTYAWNGKGNALDNLGNYQESLVAYNKALSIDPNYTYAWNNKGVALENLGRNQDALDAYNKSILIDPNFTIAQSNQERLRNKDANLLVIIVLVVLLGAGAIYGLYRIKKKLANTISSQGQIPTSTYAPPDPHFNNAATSISPSSGKGLKDHNIFISYATEDKSVADKICTLLEGNDLPCWIAPRDIAAGEKYALEIIRAIDKTKIFVVVFSRYADQSAHVRTEIERAFNHEKIIILFRIEDIEPSDEIQYFIGKHQWLDAFSGSHEDTIDKLILKVKSFTGK